MLAEFRGSRVEDLLDEILLLHRNENTRPCHEEDWNK
jgi:hypothetical protein